MQIMLQKAWSADQHTSSLLINSFELLNKKNWIILHIILISGHDYTWQYKPERSALLCTCWIEHASHNFKWNNWDISRHYFKISHSFPLSVINPSLPCNQCFLTHYEDNTTWLNIILPDGNLNEGKEILSLGRRDHAGRSDRCGSFCS